MQSKHIADEADMGSGVPALLRHSPGSPKVPAPQPDPRSRPPASKDVGSGGNSTFGCLTLGTSDLEVMLQTYGTGVEFKLIGRCKKTLLLRNRGKALVVF